MSLLLLLRDAATLNADYQALLTHAEGEGDTLPVAAAQTAGSDFITALQGNGLWDKIGAMWMYYHPSSDQETFSYENWKAPASYRRTKVNSPVFTAKEGWQGSGTNGCLASGLNLDTAGFNAAVSVFVEAWATSFGYLYGCGGDTFSNMQSATRIDFKNQSTAQQIVSGASAAAGLRTSVRSGGNLLYYIGSTLTQTTAVALDSTSGTNFTDFAFNSSGVAGSNAKASMTIVWSSIPDATDLANLVTAYTAYKTAIAAI